jgi:hypothetical protein
VSCVLCGREAEEYQAVQITLEGRVACYPSCGYWAPPEADDA